MKIKLCANWSTSEEVTARLLRQFSPTNHNNIEFVHDQSYDKIIFFNYVSEEIKPNHLSYVLPQEPFWAGSHQKNFKNIDNLTCYGYEKDIYDSPEKIVESQAFTFYGGRGEWVDSPDIWNYNNIISESDNVVKDKIISSAITPLSNNNGEFCLYPQRHATITNLIQKNVNIDYYGGWDRFFNLENVKNSPLKIDTVKNYKFTLIMENEYRKNWISEKFYDAILWNTIPIYYGCKNVSEIYPNGGYIEILDLNNIENIVNDVINNADDYYDTLLPKLKEIKYQYLIKNNMYTRISEIAGVI